MAQPIEVVKGQDLLAWRKIPHAELAPADRATAYGHFIHAYPSSPLAEVAWRRLEHAQRRALADQPRSVVSDLDRSLHAHDQQLQRVNRGTTVVSLDDQGQVSSVERTWNTAMHAGVTLDAGGASATGGLRVGRGAWSGIARVSRGASWTGEATVRLDPGWWGPLYVESGVAIRPDLMALAAGGLRARWVRQAWIEASVGLGVGPDIVTPIGRVELTYQLSRSDRTQRRP